MAKPKLPEAGEFPSNSIINSELPPVTSKRIVSGKVLRKKKSAVGSFFGDDLGIIAKSVIEEILLPALKTMLSETVSTAIDMALFGEPRSRKRTSNRTGSTISYGSFYQDIASGKKDRTRRRSGKRVEDIILEDRGEAKDVISAMLDILEEYDEVTIADLYELTGIEGQPSDSRYGWRNLSKAEVRRTGGGFLLDLPDPIELEP